MPDVVRWTLYPPYLSDANAQARAARIEQAGNDGRLRRYRIMVDTIPGIQVVERTTNLDGRSGIALGLGNEHEQDQLIIDTGTGTVIGSRAVAGAQPYEPWNKPGTELEATAVSTAVVDDGRPGSAGTR